MLYRSLLVAFIFGTVATAYAQQPANYTPKPLPIDYHQVDAPMPKVKLVTLDTLSKLYEGKQLKKMNKKNTKKFGYTPATRIITNDDINNTGNVFVMMFNPNCGHCEDQTEILKKNIDQFKTSTLILMANAVMKTYLPDFVKNHKTHDFYPKMIVGIDSGEVIKEAYLYGALPQINIYNSKHKLLKSFNGEIPIDSLKMYMN